MSKQHLPLPPVCVDCGSTKLKMVERDILFSKSNPGTIVVPKRTCVECQNCGEQFIGERASLKKFKTST